MSKREVRVLLPSGRVAVFRVPNVGEYMALRDEGLKQAYKTSDDPSGFEVGDAVGKLALRRLLVGISEQPTPVLYKPGFDLEVAKQKVKEQLEVAKAESTAPVQDFDDALDAVCMQNEDVDAMKAAANVREVNDLVWDEGSGILKKYPLSDLGTPEAHDWEQLNLKASRLVPELVTESDPKAPRRRTRPLR